jgi:peptide/nickel transport system substrate-binding protein
MMKMKRVWLLVSCLIVAAVLLASCGPTAVEEEEGKTITGKVIEKEEAVEEKEEVATEEKEMVLDSLGRLVQKPEYGGAAFIATSGITTFIPASLAGGVYYLGLESLLIYDPLTGPSGTGEFMTLVDDWWIEPEAFTGLLAESWEQTDLTTFIFNLRKGVRFFNKPPVNGREMDAEDVVFSIKWMEGQPRWVNYRPPGTPEERLFKAIALDKYTVKVIMPEPDAMWINDWPHLLRILPRELEGMDLEKWENHIGTGPWINEDYVDGSSFTVRRNPDYWMKDPFHPDNQLPYMDSLTQLIILDVATRYSALRTGKIDYIDRVPRLQGKNLLQTNPELKYTKSARDADRLQVFWRTDTEPFNDVRVRQALFMALDWDALVNDYFDGEAVKLTWPYYSYHKGYYTPLEELPEELQQLYEYHPDKSRQLLAEAGYPNGFKTNVINYQVLVEPLSLIKDYWANIGVDLEIRVMEPGAYGALFYGKKYDALIASQGTYGNAAPEMTWRQFSKPGHIYNCSMIDDSYINEQYAKVCNTMDLDEQKRIMKELGVYYIEQCYALNFPSAYSFTFWQPWLIGQSGELYSGPYWNQYFPLQYCWVDRELKAELGY